MWPGHRGKATLAPGPWQAGRAGPAAGDSASSPGLGRRPGRVVADAVAGRGPAVPCVTGSAVGVREGLAGFSRLEEHVTGAAVSEVAEARGEQGVSGPVPCAGGGARRPCSPPSPLQKLLPRPALRGCFRDLGRRRHLGGDQHRPSDPRDRLPRAGTSRKRALAAPGRRLRMRVTSATPRRCAEHADAAGRAGRGGGAGAAHPLGDPLLTHFEAGEAPAPGPDLVEARGVLDRVDACAAVVFVGFSGSAPVPCGPCAAWTVTSGPSPSDSAVHAGER